MKRWQDNNDKYAKYEKIRRSRRKPNEGRALASEFVSEEKNWGDALAKGAFAARIVEVHKRYAFVSREDTLSQVDTKDVWLATVARKFLLAGKTSRNFVSVGDRVLCTPAEKQFANVGEDLPCCVIQNMAPRTSEISRIDPMRQDLKHVLAANVDQLVIVASFLKPRVKWGLIDRYLVLAESQRIPSLIVFTKKDLLKSEASEKFAQECEERVALYKALGYGTFVLQANDPVFSKKQADAKLLKEELRGKTSILSGHSGVGKSSVVNLFSPEIVQIVEPDEDIFYKGRHTTSFASFLKLGIGGYAIDTPGIRSFLIDERDPIQLSDAFVEMRPLLGQCKYRECRHIDEPECVVRRGVKDGSIAEWRYKSYLTILTGATGREGRLRDVDLTEE